MGGGQKDIPADAWFFSFEEHPKAHTNRNSRMINCFGIFCERYHKLRWTSPEICKPGNLKIKYCLMRGKHLQKFTWDYRRWWTGYLSPQHGQQQQEAQCAYYHSRALTKAWLSEIDLHAESPRIIGCFRSLKVSKRDVTAENIKKAHLVRNV